MKYERKDERIIWKKYDDRLMLNEITCYGLCLNFKEM